MLELDLFVGFPVNPSLQAKLHQVKPELYSYYVGKNPAYLEEKYEGEQLYLGKKIGNEVDLEQIKLVSENVYSSLKKLLPDHLFPHHSLLLFPIPHE